MVYLLTHMAEWTFDLPGVKDGAGMPWVGIRGLNASAWRFVEAEAYSWPFSFQLPDRAPRISLVPLALWTSAGVPWTALSSNFSGVPSDSHSMLETWVPITETLKEKFHNRRPLDLPLCKVQLVRERPDESNRKLLDWMLIQVEALRDAGFFIFGVPSTRCEANVQSI